MNKDNKLNALTILAIVFIALSLWNTKLSEAKEDYSLTNMENKNEILWLARVIYSESKKADEQVLVAWVVRNRVETNFRGKSYESVATSKGQFSGLHKSDAQFAHNISRNYNSTGLKWQEALKIAEAVFYAPEFLRPFPKTVRHFYSPRSVRISPEWSANNKPVVVVKDSSNNKNIRFAFYDGVK